MKKVLLSTSAIALAGAFGSAANASEWNVRVGGYMEQYVAYAASDVDSCPRFAGCDPNDDFNGVDSKQDAEIFVIPTITLDNGLKIGANIQIEAASTGDQIDESYMFIQGSFGEVNLGSENSAGYKMHYAAPDVTFVNVNSGSLTAFIPFSGAGAGSDVFRGTLGATYLENDRNNDAQRITYYTPRFAGFQFGASYARDPFQDTNAQVNCENITCDYIDLGANYVNSFGEFDVALSARWGIAFNPDGNDPTVLGFGANFGYGGFTIGGSWAEQNNSTARNPGTPGIAPAKSHIEDGTAWDAGVSYETGPWGFSFTYFHGENVNNDCGNVGAVAACTAGFDEELSQYLLGVNYKLAKGVDLGAFGAYVDFDEDQNTLGRGDVDGFVIGTGIKISF